MRRCEMSSGKRIVNGRNLHKRIVINVARAIIIIGMPAGLAQLLFHGLGP